MKEYSIAILGTPDTILGFKGLGLDIFGVTTVEDGNKAVSEIMQANKYGVLLITEDWAKQLAPQFDKFKGQALPAVLPIPSQDGPTGEGLKNLSRIVEQAVGSDILK